jgi:tellurite resistance protein
MGLLNAIFGRPSGPPFAITTTLDKKSFDQPILLVSAYGEINPGPYIRAKIVLSVLDKNDEKNPRSVFCVYDKLTEENTPAFQDSFELEADTGIHYPNFSEIFRIPMDFLVPPKGKRRKLKIIVRVIDQADYYPIVGGFPTQSDGGGLVNIASDELSYNFSIKGYEEKEEHYQLSRVAIIKLATMVAMADGNLDDREGLVIKNWIAKTLSRYSDDRLKKLKNNYNNTLRSSFKDAKAGRLSYGALTEELNSIGTEQDKIEAFSLCYAVLSADTIADEKELKDINEIGKALKLDPKEIEKISDKNLLKLDATIQKATNIESILSIDPKWSKARIKKYLNVQFAKWSGRLNAIDNEKEKEEAQFWIDKIGEARQKYGI